LRNVCAVDAALHSMTGPSRYNEGSQVALDRTPERHPEVSHVE
jgi:hypothetical protein